MSVETVKPVVIVIRWSVMSVLIYVETTRSVGPRESFHQFRIGWMVEENKQANGREGSIMCFLIYIYANMRKRPVGC